jgi:hypothetical protein
VRGTAVEDNVGASTLLGTAPRTTLRKYCVNLRKALRKPLVLRLRKLKTLAGEGLR